MKYPTTPFERAVDRAIAQENERVIAGLCPKCGGTGRFYTQVNATVWRRHTCPTCEGTGER